LKIIQSLKHQNVEAKDVCKENPSRENHESREGTLPSRRSRLRRRKLRQMPKRR